jgi:hypothetical protein
LKIAVGSNPCFLDTLRFTDGLTATHPTKIIKAIDCLHEAARKRKIDFIPTYQIGSQGTVLREAVRTSLLLDCRGLALRYAPLSEVPVPGTSRGSTLLNALSDFNIEATEVYMIIDFGWLDPEREMAASLVCRLVREITQLARWKGVIVLGTTIPPAMSCVKEGTIGKLPRMEWSLWKTIQSSVDGPLIFGDYCVQHPTPPSSSGRGMRANIRYTTEDQTLVTRGSGPVATEGKEQYVNLCKSLIEQPDYRGAAFSPGDRRIAECAAGELDPGGQTTWRGAGTSHHLRAVTEQLKRAQAEPT